jgi:hypothetical protein
VNAAKTIINYSSESAIASFKTRNTQTINPISDLTLSTIPSTVTVTATSGLAVALAKVSGNITINGNVITILGPGPVKVTATQNGNDNFDPAADATVNFCANPPMPTITIQDVLNPVEVRLLSSSATNNQWFHNNAAVVGATSQTYAPHLNGIFAVKVDFEGCSNMSAPTAFLYTGVEEFGGSAIKVFPNPFNNQLTIEAPGTVKKLTLADALGRIQHTEDRPQNTSKVLDLSHLPEGLYSLILVTDQGTVNRKVIKRNSN